MRRCLFGLGLLLPMFLGCSGENIVAGAEPTKSQQLESALPTWCPSTCDRLRACPQNTGCECTVGDTCDCVAVDDNCEKQCRQAFARYVGTGEKCAVIGERIKSCIDGIMCSDLGGSDPCAASAAERAECPDPNDSSGDEPVAPTGPNGAGSAGSAGGYASANPVSCTGSYGVGGGMPASGGSYVTCEEGRNTCTDGHTYSWICAQDSQGQRACTCLVDTQATAGFVPISSDCPSLSQVNAGCAWALTQ
jgi:hypothetical protein